jgi:hypothetical protein
MALSGESADLVMTLKKSGSALPPLAVSPLCTAPFLHMTIVCIDILEKISIESRKSHGQPPFRRT